MWNQSSFIRFLFYNLHRSACRRGKSMKRCSEVKNRHGSLPLSVHFNRLMRCNNFHLERARHCRLLSDHVWLNSLTLTKVWVNRAKESACTNWSISKRQIAHSPSKIYTICFLKTILYCANNVLGFSAAFARMWDI